MYLVINKCVTAVKVSNLSGHYLRNRSTLDIGVWTSVSQEMNHCHDFVETVINIYRGADKSLARPGRKQTTAIEDFEFYISYL